MRSIIYLAVIGLLFAVSSAQNDEGEIIQAEQVEIPAGLQGINDDEVILPEGYDDGYVGKSLTSGWRRPCCSPDFVFIIDITDGVGFSRYDCEAHIRDFLVETINRAAIKYCDQVRASVIEYGNLGRIRWDFNRYQDTYSLKYALSRYTPGRSLGSKSNAQAGFTGARIVLTNATRGYRYDSPAWVFWITKSTPVNPAHLHYYVNSRIKRRAFVINVAVGYNVNFRVTKRMATTSSYAFWVADILNLVDKCSEFYFDWCPFKRTTTPAITTTTSTTTTSTTTTTPTTTTTQPDPTTPTTTTTTTTRPTTSTTTTTTTKPTTTTTKATTTTTKPTTTTTKPTTTTTTVKLTTTTEKITTTLPNPTTPVPPSEFCFGCRSRRNHKDLYADTADCHFYYQCFYFNETYAVGIRRNCPAGTFWHDEVLSCMPEGAIPCQDQCLDDAVHAKGCYAGAGCRQFFVCANTASYGMCCPPGSRFNSATCGCDEDETCNDFCVQEGPAVPTTVLPPQQLNATFCRDSFGSFISSVPGESNAYVLVDEVSGIPTEKRFCPDGISFDVISCRCDIEDGATLPPVQAKRQAILWVNFDQDTNDHSVNKYATFLFDGASRDANVAAHGSGSGSFNNGYLSVPGLKTYDMRDQGSWAAFFRCEQGNGFNCLNTGGILSNNKDQTSSRYTIIIAAQSDNTVTARLSFWHPTGNQQVNAVLNAPANGWNHVCVTYDSNTINLHVNGAIVDTVFIGGYLSVAHCPYVIGHDQAFGYFTGHIDDVLVTPFAMEQSEIDAHRNGDRAFLQARGFF